MPASSAARLAGAVAIATARAALLGACQQQASSGSATPTSGVPRAGSVPEPALNPSVGSGCRPQINRFREILDYDASVGRVSKDVYGRAITDLKQADVACDAGREVQARTILTQTKRNYGYPL